MYRSAVCVLVLCVGCEREAERSPQWPRLLSEKELASYLAAEEALDLRDKSFEDMKALCSLQREDVARELARYSFTTDTFLEVAELVLFARYGREAFGELPQKKHALCTELLKRCQGPGDEQLRERLQRELEITELVESKFVATVLANAQILRDFERRRRAGRSKAVNSSTAARSQ
jgi:hypothetical protein